MRRVVLALGLWLALVGAAPIRLITQLSQARIEINTTFRGSEMLVFGAIQYPQGSVPDAPPDIAVVVRGPSAPVTVRQKARIAGIWVNARAVRFESVPGFYAVAATRPISVLADERTTAIYEIGIRNLQLSPASGADDGISRTFEAGLITARQKAGLFTERSDGVQITPRRALCCPHRVAGGCAGGRLHRRNPPCAPGPGAGQHVGALCDRQIGL